MAGRPTKWTQDIQDQAWGYANGEWEAVGHAFPSLVGLASHLNLNRSTVSDWATQKDKQFSSILEKINADQQLVAWNKGLRGDYNANLVKLLLGKHGYHDKQDSTMAGPDGGAIKTDNNFTVEFVNAPKRD